MSLKNSLPNIIKQALENEDAVTRNLILVLWNEVITHQGSSSLKQIAQKALDDYIDQAIKMEKEMTRYGI